MIAAVAHMDANVMDRIAAVAHMIEAVSHMIAATAHMIAAMAHIDARTHVGPPSDVDAHGRDSGSISKNEVASERFLRTRTRPRRALTKHGVASKCR